MSNSGIDWSGLFNWSAKYNDGTSSTNFSPMSPEEKEWLEKAMTQYTYNETDRMQEIVKVMFEHEKTAESEILENLEELYELVDIHPRNSVNLDKAGGFKLLMEVMFQSKHAKCRKLAMEIFGAIVQNTAEMQEIAYKHGGLNLMYKYVEETEEKNKEMIIGSLSSLIRTSIKEIKAVFFLDMQGLEWMKQILLDSNASKRTLKKVYFLLYDLIVKETDKSVEKVLTVDHPVKDFIVDNHDIILKMLNSLDYTIEENLFSDHVLREFILKCVGGIFQYKSELVSTEIEEYLANLYKTISKQIFNIKDNNGDEDTIQLLEDEAGIVSKIVDRQGDFLLIH